MRLLEQALSHGSHDSLVFTDALRNTNQRAEFWWQINVLPFLLDFKKWLVQVHDGDIILLLEVEDHRNSLTDLALLKLAGLRSHIPLNRGYFIGFVLAIARHYNCAFKFFIYRL